MNTFKVTFDKSNRNYLPGEEVKCTWYVHLSHTKNINSIYVIYKGYAQVKWIETRTVKKNKRSHPEIVNYRADQNFFKYYQTVFGVREGLGVTLKADDYVYHTSFRLPENLPQSYEGTYGHIRFDVKIIMDVKLKPYETYSDYFYVGPWLNLNDFRYLHEHIDNEEAKTFGFFCWKSEALKIVTKLPRKGFRIGEIIKFKVEVNNDSDVDIKKMEVKLIEKVSFFSQSPSLKSRTTERELWCHDYIQDRALVLRMQRKIFDVQFYLDPTWEFKVFNTCTIILVQYFFKVNVIPESYHPNLSNLTQITIGTVPFDPHVTPPIAPNADISTPPPPATVREQPLPSYHDAING